MLIKALLCQILWEKQKHMDPQNIYLNTKFYILSKIIYEYDWELEKGLNNKEKKTTG